MNFVETLILSLRRGPLIAAAICLPGGIAFGVTDPTLTVSFTRSNPNLIVNWNGYNGVSYQVQSSSNLTSWVNVGPVMTNTGFPMSFTNSGLNQRRLVFRIQRVFPAAPGTASFDPATGIFTVVGDLSHTNLSIANDGTGLIVVTSNGSLQPIAGGVPTTANTVLIQVLGSSGDDQISVGNGLPVAHLFGAEGNDILFGGSSADLIVGGPGIDTLTGKQGNDVLYPDGGDTVVWNPGDGSDIIQGSGGNNTLNFNSANVNENIELFANGSRLQLTRNVANILLDMDGIQTVTLHTLGGIDNVVVDDLTGTDVTKVNVDLAATIGTTNGDGAADTVTVTGTTGSDTFNVSANGNAVEVTGVGATVDVVNGELANDRIAFSGLAGDTINVNGTAGADTLQVLPSPVAGYVRAIVSGYTAPVDVTGDLTLSVNGLGGPDTIIGQNGVAALAIPIVLDGGDGDDIITGTDASDFIFGGTGNDIVSGGRGNDIIYLGDGNDTASWNPGDGSDTIEGQTGSDTLLFNGANVSEIFELSANGSRARFTRNVANVIMDLNSIETVNVNALGGVDNLIVDDLTGTSVTQVNVDLAAAGGVSGDGAADTVTVNGTSGSDVFNVAANGAAVEVVGPGARIDVSNAELANDRIAFTGVGGDTINVNGTSGADTMQVLASPVAGYVRAIVSGYTAPVDVNGAATLAVNGLGGPDTIIGQNGVAALAIPIVLDGGDGDDNITGTDAADTIYGGNDNDTVAGGRGDDVIFLGAGTDTAVWNPGDGSDTIEGQTGSDTLLFNGANVNEIFELSANGSRARFTRNVANVIMDLNSIETVNVNALGGVDNLIVDDLTGTSVTQVNVDLAAAGGSSGDGAADTVTVNGTASPDIFNVTAVGTSVQVAGLHAGVIIAHPEVANDSVTINGLGGTDMFNIGPGVTALIGVVLNQ